jgi:hypothetical protein
MEKVRKTHCSLPTGCHPERSEGSHLLKPEILRATLSELSRVSNTMINEYVPFCHPER